MKKQVKILVADDHPILLKGLIDELQTNGYQMVNGATNGAQALEILVAERPEIAILDIEMPVLSGFEVIRKGKENGVNCKYIILTSHKERGFVLKAKKLNISGYILKDEPFEELDQCITAVLKGKNYFSSAFSDIVQNEINPQLQKIKYLSPSERTIVRMVAQGNSSKEIAELLSISYRTVQKHRGNIITKLALPPSGDPLLVWVTENKELILSM